MLKHKSFHEYRVTCDHPGCTAGSQSFDALPALLASLYDRRWSFSFASTDPLSLAPATWFCSHHMHPGFTD